MQPYQKALAESMEVQAALKRIQTHTPDIDIPALLNRINALVQQSPHARYLDTVLECEQKILRGHPLPWELYKVVQLGYPHGSNAIQDEWALGEYENGDIGCPRCGRMRLCKCPNGKHRCEKCNWSPELNGFAPSSE